MGRRVFTIDFKREAVKVVRERGVTISQAAKDLGLHVTVLRKWVRDARANGPAAFPGRASSDLTMRRLHASGASWPRPGRSATS